MFIICRTTRKTREIKLSPTRIEHWTGASWLEDINQACLFQSSIHGNQVKDMIDALLGAVTPPYTTMSVIPVYISVHLFHGILRKIDTVK